jgi:integrase
LEALTKQEIRSLLAYAMASSARDWLMILVAYWHGLRASELIAIVRDDVQDGQLTVKRLKGSKRTVHPLIADDDPVFNESAGLAAFMRGFKGNQRLFPVTRMTFFRIMRKHGKAAGLPIRKCHPHILKHSIAMQTIQSAGIENVRQYLGHKSISSTGAYLKVSDSDASSAISKAARGR